MIKSYNENQQLIIREALRQTELHIEDLQATATVAEARAFQFSASCVLLATLASALAQSALSPFSVYVSSCGLIAAAFWAICSALPRKFHIRGHRWELWQEHVVDDDCFDEVLISQANENDIRIRENFQKLEESAFHFLISLKIAFCSMVFFVLGQVVAVYHSGIGIFEN